MRVAGVGERASCPLFGGGGCVGGGKLRTLRRLRTVGTLGSWGRVGGVFFVRGQDALAPVGFVGTKIGGGDRECMRICTFVGRNFLWVGLVFVAGIAGDGIFDP